MLQETLLRIVIRANHAGGLISEKAQQGEGKRVKRIGLTFLTPSKDCYSLNILHGYSEQEMVIYYHFKPGI